MEDEEAGGGEGGDADGGGGELRMVWGMREREWGMCFGQSVFLRGGGDARGRVGMH